MTAAFVDGFIGGIMVGTLLGLIFGFWLIPALVDAWFGIVRRLHRHGR